MDYHLRPFRTASRFAAAWSTYSWLRSLSQSLGVLVLAALLGHFNSSHVLGAVGLGVVLLGVFFAHAIAKRNATQADHA